MENAWGDLERPPLRALPLRRALVGPHGWAALTVVAGTGSTNADLLARTGALDATVLVADHQDSGRGRLGRTWSAPPRSSLAVSVLLRPTTAPEWWSWLPMLTGVAVVEALTGLGVDAGLKWPNDVLVTGPGRPGKVCGILAEMRPASDAEGARVVLGAGINVSQCLEELPSPLQSAAGSSSPATSLALAGARSTDRDTVLRSYLRALRESLQRWASQPESVRDAYRARSATIGTDVRAQLPDGCVLVGRAVDVDATGRLVIETSDGTATSLTAGDVVHLRRG
ncbi:MAG: biotin--[acetyl-CoA-carboxylase] ligase [Janthinobacterium lividum]